MEFSVSKTALLNELSTTQGVVERKTTIPILSNLLVEAKGSTLTITATDLELSIRTSCEAKVKKEGAGTIPAKKLLELVRLLPEGEIKFRLLENHWVEIVSDRKKYKLVGMAKENFPALPAMPHTTAASTFTPMSSMKTHSAGSRPSVPAAYRKIRIVHLAQNPDTGTSDTVIQQFAAEDEDRGGEYCAAGGDHEFATPDFTFLFAPGK